MTSPGARSSPKKSMLNWTGSVELSMNWGMPTERADRRPLQSRIVALRSLLWLRIGVVAVRETNVAISKQTVSMAERITSAVTRSIAASSRFMPPPFETYRPGGAIVGRLSSSVVAVRHLADHDGHPVVVKVKDVGRPI